MSSENYMERMRQALPHRSDTELELMAVNTPQVRKFTGMSAHEHRMAAMRRLFPSRRDNPWRDDMISGYQRCRDENRKEYLLLGASNSTKTSNMADLAVTLWFENPVVTSVLIASPYVTATESGIWARVIEQFHEARDANPELPGRVLPSDNSIVFNTANPLSFIRVVTMDQIGKLVGKKSKTFGIGIFIIIMDELPELPRPEVLIGGAGSTGVLANLRSVPNFLFMGAGNFADPTDALGLLTEPAAPVQGFEQLDLHSNYEWISTRGGLVKRYDGDRSPNILAGHDIYPFLPTLEYREDLRSLPGGDQSPDYFRYWHSFPLLSQIEFTITNSTKIRNGRAQDEAVYNSQPVLRGASCDPGFGGDPCILQFWKIGWIVVDDTDEHGEPVKVTIQAFELSEPPITVPIKVGLSESRDVEDQIAEFCKAACEERKIEQQHFSFDDSMRGGIVQSFMRIWGTRVVAISMGGQASTRRLSAIRRKKDANKDDPRKNTRTARDVYFNANSEMHFAVGDVIQAGQFRGLARSPAAERQLTRRRWRWHGDKKKIEDKLEFKKGNGGKSPNESDTVVLAIEHARRLGFVLHSVASAGGGVMKLLADLRREQQIKAMVAKQMATQSGESPRLNPGALHATSHHAGNGFLKRAKVLRR